MWKRRTGEKTLDDVVEYLHGFGEMLQSIDARLQDIANLLGVDDDEEADA